jgi:hypothetical protein
MTKPATLILNTTRSGSRCSVHWLNQPVCCCKGEPNRRKRPPLWPMRKGEPGAKRGPLQPPVEWQASSLLVILHYLLKNNTTFMEWNVQGRLGILDLLSTCKFTSGGAQPW